MMLDSENHAERNARAWLDEIVQRAVVPGSFVDPEDDDAVEESERWAWDAPLSVEVRDGWRTVGADPDTTPAEYRILLSTGGPALRVWGELNIYGEPGDADCRMELQYQDWGTPWTPLPLSSEDEESALRWFVQTVVVLA